MSNIKISVCVPVYGVEKYIEKCARTLFEQTLQEGVEFIFVNDCTRDNSIEILKKVLSEYPQRHSQVRIIDHNRNRGLSAARNTAVANAAGDFIYHLDSDDHLCANTLEAMLDLAVKEQADFVAGSMRIIYEDCEKILQVKPYLCQYGYLRNMLTRQVKCGVVGNLIKKTLYTQHNIQAPEDVNMGEDYAVTPRLIYWANKVSYHPEPFYCYIRFNADSYSNKPTLKNLQNVAQVHNLLEDFFVSQGADCPIKSDVLREMRVENFAFMLQYAVSDLSLLKWLQKNFPCRVLLKGTRFSFKVKTANLLFQLHCLWPITLVFKLLRFLRSI